jgi:hypothetical protein
MLSIFTVNHLGPQTKFPVPEGILNYAGKNYIAITIWAQQAAGAKLDDLKLEVDAEIQSAYRKPELSWSGTMPGKRGMGRIDE